MSPGDDDYVLFEHVHMEGKRFRSHALPLAATEELARYGALVEKVARSLFRRDYPNKKRVGPSLLGVESFEFAIRNITDGTVGLDLTVPRITGDALLGSDYVERARVLIEEALSSLAEGQGLPSDFPTEATPEIARLGMTLEDGDRLTWARSKRVVKRSKAVLTETTTTPVRGPRKTPVSEELIHAYVVGVCSGPLEFQFKREGGERTYRGKFELPETFNTLHEVCGFANRAPLVALTVLRQQSEGRAIVDVLGVEVVLPSEWSVRLQEFSELAPGWLDGRGLPPSKEALQATESLLLKLLESGLPRPGIFPMPDGGVQLEWGGSSGGLEIEVASVGSVTLYHEDEDDEGFLGPVGCHFASGPGGLVSWRFLTCVRAKCCLFPRRTSCYGTCTRVSSTGSC